MALLEYEYLERTEGVCGGRPVIKGTRIEPHHVVNYGTLEETMSDFNLTREQVIECYHFVKKNGS